MAREGDAAGHDDDRVIDLDRAALIGEPPVPGAQWDELHRRWEHWDEINERWVIVGDDRGSGVDPLSENPIPALLARELLRTAELEEDDDEPKIVDIDRLAAPKHTVPGAQWNEVRGCWERWDDAAGTWVEVAVDTSSDAP